VCVIFVWFAEKKIIFLNNVVDVSNGDTVCFCDVIMRFLSNIYIKFRIELTKLYVFMQWVDLPKFPSSVVAAWRETYLYDILQYL
jgi:hypothetical protein